MSTEPIAVRPGRPVLVCAFLVIALSAGAPAMGERQEQQDSSANRVTSADASASKGADDGSETRSAEPGGDAAAQQDADGEAEQRTELARRWLQARAERAQRSSNSGRPGRGSVALPRRSSKGDRSGEPARRGRAEVDRQSQGPVDGRRAGRSPAGVRENPGAERAAGPERNEPSPGSNRSAAGQAQPKESPRTYTIREGDTFSSLARRFYGGTTHWKRIAEVNPDVDPDRLKVGQTIRLPRLEGSNSGENEDSRDRRGSETSDSVRASRQLKNANAQAASSNDATGGSRTVQVRSGDTLSSIAERVYGEPGHWRRILEANRDRIDQPKRLRVGTELRLPAESSEDDGAS